MPNPLTGDFDAVLQVSGTTINRLLASMHQNAFADRDLPSFPHTVGFRIGDNHMFDNVKGTVYAQIGVPAVDLIHGATDRFILEVGVRAWYQPHPGTEPLPAFIHGTVRAEYRVHDIDASCPGWARAADFLWVRVVRGSVTFDGTAENEWSGTGVQEVVPQAPASSAETIDTITRQIAWQLATRFEATPHRLKPGFRRGMLRSLRPSPSESAVALPLAPSGGEPFGSVHSIDSVLLTERDLAIAISVQHVMSQVAPFLGMFGSVTQIPVGDTVYRMALAEPPSIKWLPQGTRATLEMFAKGSATTDSALPDATFEILQAVTLDFDGGKFQLHALSPSVKVEPSGDYSTGFFAVADLALGALHTLGFTDIESLRAHLRNTISAKVSTLLNGALTTVALPEIGGQALQLANQLKTLDDKVGVWVDTAEFLADGIILRGTITVAPRQPVVVKHDRTPDGQAHSALESWIPGGRIDRLEWSWSWTGSGEPGSAAFRDRFLLRRPPGEFTRWGLSGSIKTPLPGLDGYGEVCLQISGVRIHPVSGKLEPVLSQARCMRFGGWLTTLAGERSRLFLRDMPQLSKGVPFPQLRARPVLAVPRRQASAGTVNTLVLHVGNTWSREIAETLAAGLRKCGRYDAGLNVLVLFGDGVLEARGAGFVEEIETLVRGLGVAAHVNEDVEGGWSRALQRRGGSGRTVWAIIAPDGTLTWSYEGRIAPDVLTSALDRHLRQSRDFAPVPYRPLVEVGARLSAMALSPTWREPTESPCPPIPLFGRFGEDTVITFVHKQSEASTTHLRRLTGAVPILLVVVDGADAREIETLRRDAGVDFVAIPDPTGAIGDRFEISMWPTTIMLDRAGTVVQVDFGVAGRRDVDPIAARIRSTGRTAQGTTLDQA